jgi:hypothetical protein
VFSNSDFWIKKCNIQYENCSAGSIRLTQYICLEKRVINEIMENAQQLNNRFSSQPFRLIFSTDVWADKRSK